MAAPMLVPLILLGGATIALAAASSKKKAAQPPLGTGKTYTLDANMPAPLRDQVLAALATEQDPQKLEAFASAIELQYPGAAAALRMKETVLRAQVPSVSPSQAPPRTSPVPHLPVDPGPLPSLPIPIDPGLLSIPSVPLPVPAARRRRQRCRRCRHPRHYPSRSRRRRQPPFRRCWAGSTPGCRSRCREPSSAR